MILASLRATALLLVLCCVAYPALVTGIAQLAFHDAANGSLLRDGETVIGSELVGQAFTSPGYLQGRPSAAGAGYDAAASSGSNFGPTSRKLADRRAADEARLVAENPDAPGPVPEVLLAASGSGLDPHLPPDAARWQLPRIAKARGVELARVTSLLDEQARGRDLGVLGEPTVNVLAFNLALDRRFPAGAVAGPR
ncbi:MAG: potassium-transporting ATPase subunit KdpC [Pseudomonadota bacterium]|nr:potassium-transporting ATPase subunit KdpC [Pseudomonadota bacterium]